MRRENRARVFRYVTSAISQINHTRCLGALQKTRGRDGVGEEVVVERIDKKTP